MAKSKWVDIATAIFDFGLEEKDIVIIRAGSAECVEDTRDVIVEVDIACALTASGRVLRACEFDMVKMTGRKVKELVLNSEAQQLLADIGKVIVHPN